MSSAGSIATSGTGAVEASRSCTQRWPSTRSQVHTGRSPAASSATGSSAPTVMTRPALASSSWLAMSLAVASAESVVTVAPARLAP